MKTITIKTFLYLSVLNMLGACSTNSNNNTNTVATGEKSPDTIIINGIVKTVNFGKDGYTADVQTAKEGVYAALVSISNLGGRENYKSCEVGDTVIFEGVLTVLDSIRQLKATKILSIKTVENTEGVAVLNERYNKIQKDEHCWQTNKVMDLHKQPDSKSKVEGKHFAGELLKVLGTKVINNQLWVNVQYHLKVKAGYEDQFADGQVMSSGSPIGWIGGEEIPKINCK